jgi:hypothetical protein
MRIAILDPRIHATGLIKLFPEADYFVIGFEDGRYDLDKTPERFVTTHGFRYREDIEAITGGVYDALFIVYPWFDFREQKRRDVLYHFEKIREIVDRSAWRKIIGFSNDDSPFDPAIECGYLKASVWFKRNYQSTTTYSSKVHPFPFFLFGHVCPLWRVLTETNVNAEKIDRVLWAGNIPKRHSPTRNSEYLSRRALYNAKIPGGRGLFKNRLRDHLKTVRLPNHLLMRELARSRFVLDMNGEGDPNNRTFELLTTDSLILQQVKRLVWPFDAGEAFSEETIYETPEELMGKLACLRADESLYNRCLANQKYIKAKYFNREWLRSYLLKYIGPL